MMSKKCLLLVIVMITMVVFVLSACVKKTEITEGLIKNVHHILVKDVRGGTLEPGQYREVQNYVVNTATREIIHTPPAPEEVPGLMKEFVEWLNNMEDVPPVLVAGITQHKFVDIHPFIDGNGRTARVLCTLILYLNGYDFKRLFSLSEFYDTNRPGYYHAIQSVRQNGLDLTPWLEYFIDGLKVQMLEVKNRGEATIKKEIIMERSKKAGLNERQENIMLYLLENNKATVDEIKQKHDIVRRTVQRRGDGLVFHRQQRANRVDDAACRQHMPDVGFESRSDGVVPRTLQRRPERGSLVSVRQKRARTVWNDQIQVTHRDAGNAQSLGDHTRQPC